MNDIIRDKLRVLATDELMLKAIRHVIEDKIKKNEPRIGDSDDDTVLGQKYRASTEAKRIINEALSDISSYNNKKVNNKQINKGI